MRILIIGGGGREHALAWRLAQSPSVEALHIAPGNPGAARCGQLASAGDSSPGDYLSLARQVRADLTVVGPEAPLVAGVVDTFRAASMLIVGPTAEAARLEGSKVFAKRFFRQRGIPTAEFAIADSTEEALASLNRFSYPVVIKADGLAAGKGVVIAQDRNEAEAAIRKMPGRLVLEEFLVGEEVSFIALCDGRDVVPLEPTQDHKTVFDRDLGPNTGGMGAYCDSRILTQAETGLILRTIIQPAVEATRFTGFLYAGLMMTANGPKVLEFNVRLGDPETQPLMHRVRSDFAEVLLASACRGLSSVKLDWRPGPSLCVVMASGGYPGTYSSGLPIHGIEEAELTGATVFHAGTSMGPSGLETAGGRVLGVTAAGDTLREAMENAYRATAAIHFAGAHFRTDIGAKGLRRYNGS